METNNFIEKFAEALEIDDMNSLSVQTVFRDLEEWDSLAYLNIIAMLDEEFEVQIENAQFKQLITIGDIIDYLNRQ
ncbi:MAG: acyl carrier protein [Muribaculaceae bacterium]|nr:acyl carrier protein [Muribaculaceae bacterium]